MLGCAQIASIMTCRFMDATGNGWVSDAIRCFEYCLSKGAHVLSNSWGGVDYSQALQARAHTLRRNPIYMFYKVGLLAARRP